MLFSIRSLGLLGHVLPDRLTVSDIENPVFVTAFSYNHQSEAINLVSIVLHLLFSVSNLFTDHLLHLIVEVIHFVTSISYLLKNSSIPILERYTPVGTVIRRRKRNEKSSSETQYLRFTSPRFVCTWLFF